TGGSGRRFRPACCTPWDGAAAEGGRFRGDVDATTRPVRCSGLGAAVAGGTGGTGRLPGVGGQGPRSISLVVCPGPAGATGPGVGGGVCTTGGGCTDDGG